MYSAPSLASNQFHSSVLTKFCFVFNETVSGKRALRQSNKQQRQSWLTKGMFAWNCFIKNNTKIREYTAVEFLEAREGAEYIVLYTRV